MVEYGDKLSLPMSALLGLYGEVSLLLWVFVNSYKVTLWTLCKCAPGTKVVL